MISFRWRDLTIAVDASGTLVMQGTADATSPTLEAIGDLLHSMGRLVGVDQAATLGISPAALVAGRTPFTAQPATAPSASAPRNQPLVQPSLGALTGAVDPAVGSYGPVPINTKPGPRRTAAWLRSQADFAGLTGTAAQAVGQQPQNSALPVSALPVSALPVSAVPVSALPVSALPVSALPISAPPTISGLAAPAATVSPATVSPATVSPAAEKPRQQRTRGGLYIALPGLVKPGPVRTTTYLAQEGTSAAAEDLNAGLMHTVVTHVSKPGPKQTSRFLATAGDAAETNGGFVEQFADSMGDAEQQFIAPTRAPMPAAQSAVAVESAPAIQSVPTPTSSITRRTPKGQLLREMQRWLERRGAPASVKELADAAGEEGWSLATNVEPSIVSTLRKHASIFLRNPDGSFALRAARGPTKIVRRRAVRHANDS